MRTNIKADCSGPVLLVEDCKDDAFLVRAAFEKASVSSPLIIVSDGPSALDYLAGLGNYSDPDRFPFPRLVLLDLKLPGMSGFEVLSWIREQRALASLSVVVLSASHQEQDVEEAYRRGANAYLTKPGGFVALEEMVRAIDAFWLKQNRQLTLKFWEFSGIRRAAS